MLMVVSWLLVLSKMAPNIKAQKGSHNPEWIADKVSGWGDHYHLVAQRSVLKRAISKQVHV